MRVFTVMEGSSSPTRVGIFLGMCGLQEPPPEYPAQTGIDLRNWTSSDIIERLTPHARGSTTTMQLDDNPTPRKHGDGPELVIRKLDPARAGMNPAETGIAACGKSR